MKKLTVLLALLCAVMLPFSVMAETETASVVNWEDVAPIIELSGLEGDFYALEELGLAIWLPNGLAAAEISEEDAAAGRLYLLMDEEQTAAVVVDAVHVDNMTLDQAYENAVANGMTEPEYISMNGLSAVSYKNDAINAACVVLVDTNCNMIIFSFTPIDVEGADVVYGFIAASIMPLE